MFDRTILVLARTPSSQARHKPLGGREAARALHGLLLERLAQELGRTHVPSALLLALDGAPREARAILRRFQQPQQSRSCARLDQAKGNFGQRLVAGLDAAAARGARRVLIVVDDAPELSAEQLDRAWDGLDRPGLVVGPCVDGGAWVLGLVLDDPRWPAIREALRAEVPWATEGVLGALRSLADRLALPLAELETLVDLDSLPDWRVLRSRLLGKGRWDLAESMARLLDAPGPRAGGASAEHRAARPPGMAPRVPRGPPARTC